MSVLLPKPALASLSSLLGKPTKDPVYKIPMPPCGNPYCNTCKQRGYTGPTRHYTGPSLGIGDPYPSSTRLRHSPLPSGARTSGPRTGVYASSIHDGRLLIVDRPPTRPKPKRRRGRRGGKHHRRTTKPKAPSRNPSWIPRHSTQEITKEITIPVPPSPSSSITIHLKLKFQPQPSVRGSN